MDLDLRSTRKIAKKFKPMPFLEDYGEQARKMQAAQDKAQLIFTLAVIVITIVFLGLMP
jgi:hypothetical protein